MNFQARPFFELPESSKERLIIVPSIIGGRSFSHELLCRSYKWEIAETYGGYLFPKKADPQLEYAMRAGSTKILEMTESEVNGLIAAKDIMLPN